MNAFKFFILSLTLSISCVNFAQNVKGSALGEYIVGRIQIKTDHIDSNRHQLPIRRIEPIIFIEFNSTQTLKLKWNRRFTITDKRGITDLGLNTDNPKIHGTYRIKNDTLTLKYRYSIQHFFKSAPKRRVKTKFKQKDQAAPAKRFARTEKDVFEISQYFYWKRK